MERIFTLVRDTSGTRLSSHKLAELNTQPAVWRTSSFEESERLVDRSDKRIQPHALPFLPRRHDLLGHTLRAASDPYLQHASTDHLCDLWDMVIP